MTRPLRLAATAAALLLLAACSPGGCTPRQPDPPAPVPDTGPSDPAPAPEGAPEEEAAEEEAEPEVPPAPEPVSWPHDPPGSLPAGSGGGSPDLTLWAPGMRFPMESAPAFANSQVFGYGGMNAPGPGGQCDSRNYSYPWRDNFCETRGASNAMCPSSRGHQGQDIRPATCVKSVHWIVAAEAGVVTSIGTYSVFIRGDSGRIYRYLHMDMAHVRSILSSGQRVARAQRIGKVSNDFGSTPTTIHLHFEIKAAVTDGSSTSVVFVPVYTSLVDSYGRLLLVS